MKFFIKTLFIALLFTSCNTTPKRDGYLINGNAKGIYNGIRVYLKTFGQNNRPVAVDTAMVMNEKFTFEGKVIEPEMCFLYINSVKGNLPIIVENGAYTIDIDKDNLSNSKILGSKTNKALSAYNKKIKDLNEKRRSINLATREAAQANDNEKVKSLNKELTDINTELMNSPFEFIKNNGDNYYSLFLIQTMLRRRNIDPKEVIDAYNGLDDNLKTSAKGKEILAQVDQVKKMLEAKERTEIGKIAPEFSGHTPEGKILGLKDVKSNVTIIDFWAAWCGPCRRENPNLVKLYEKYHDKGLEIIGISLDGTMRQPDPKKAWLKAIADDKLTWPQISNLNYFNGPIAKMYGVQAIPASFILDADGKIIAKKLRGPALEAKIAELLD